MPGSRERYPGPWLSGHILWGLECSEDAFESILQISHSSQQVLWEITRPSPASLFLVPWGFLRSPSGDVSGAPSDLCLQSSANSHACSVYKPVTRKWRWGQGAEAFIFDITKRSLAWGQAGVYRNIKRRHALSVGGAPGGRRAMQADSTLLPRDAHSLGGTSESWWFRAGSLAATRRDEEDDMWLASSPPKPEKGWPGLRAFCSDPLHPSGAPGSRSTSLQELNVLLKAEIDLLYF